MCKGNPPTLINITMQYSTNFELIEKKEVIFQIIQATNTAIIWKNEINYLSLLYSLQFKQLKRQDLSE